MSITETTRPSLLLRVRDLADDAAWGEFVEIYAPLIHRYALRRGLQDADAADIVQDVLREFARCVPRFDYNPDAGRFRGWLHTLTRRAVARQARQPAGRPLPAGSGEAGGPLETAEASAEQAFDEAEYQRAVFDWAARQVRSEVQPHTWNAFWLTAVDQVGPAEAARRLGISVGSVYVSKNRVLRRLQALVAQVDGTY